MMTILKKTAFAITFLSALALISACSSPLEDSLETLSESDNHTYTYTIEMEDYTINSVYKQDGNKSYYSFDGDEMYQEETEEGSTVRIVRDQTARWQRQTLTEDEHLIPPDTVILNPEQLNQDMFEKDEDDEAVHHLKESEYETLFGEKAETIKSFSFDPESDPLEINYTFTHEGKTVPVTLTITYGDADIELPI